MNLMREQCATCIFSPGNPMDLRPGRVRGMVETCIRHDVHVPCHERMTRFDDDSSSDVSEINPDDPVCRGFYDAYPGVGQMIRIFGRLNMLHEVD